MRTLLATTAVSIALGMANLAVASVSFTETNASYELDITLAQNIETPVSLTSETEDFYRGDFQITSNANLEGLTQADLYTGEGAVELSNMRWVT